MIKGFQNFNFRKFTYKRHIRKILGITLGVIGSILIIQVVPLTIWLILLGVLLILLGISFYNML